VSRGPAARPTAAPGGAAVAVDHGDTGHDGTSGAVAVARAGRVVALRAGPLSTRIDTRSVAVSLVLAALVVAGLCWSVTVGDSSIPLSDVLGELFGWGGNPDSDFVIWHLRLPRILTGVLVGAAFGLSGQVFQRLVHNPLASPDILGVSSGAAAGAVLPLAFIGGSSRAVTVSALVGAALTVALVNLLAFGRGRSSYRIVLVGIGLSAMLNAAVAHLSTRITLNDAQRATVWLTGSLSGRDWSYVRPLAVVLAVLLPLTMIAARQLRALELGDDAAQGLGVEIGRAKLLLSLTGAALAAVATAAAGPVGFVALVSPQIARRLVGTRAAGLVPAALVGSVVVVFADLLARRLFAPTELPVGAVTAIVGAPYLLWLLARANRIGSNP